MKKYLAVLALVLSSHAMAVETSVPFKIEKIFMSLPTNFYFRVIQVTNSTIPHCVGGPVSPAWSYINEADPGSKGNMAALLTAYAMNKTVQFKTVGVAQSDGRTFCQINEFMISEN